MLICYINSAKNSLKSVFFSDSDILCADCSKIYSGFCWFLSDYADKIVSKVGRQLKWEVVL